jgi:membrane protein implicated in regulation of membrane protease activity
MIRLKLWAAGMAAAVAALLSIWFGGRMSGKADAKAKRTDQRLKAMKQAEVIENEVQALDRDTLRARSSVWVRNRKQR